MQVFCKGGYSQLIDVGTAVAADSNSQGPPPNHVLQQGESVTENVYVSIFICG